MSVQMQTSLLKLKKPPLKGDFLSLAGPTGFEPAISSVTGRRVRPATPRALIYAMHLVSLLRQVPDPLTLLAQHRFFVCDARCNVLFVRFAALLIKKNAAASKCISLNASD